MRLIDADESINRIVKIRPTNPKQSDYSHGVDVGLAMAMVAIEEQPTIEPERKPQWISCRERLPNDDGEVLVSTHDFVCRGFYAYGKWYGCSYGSLYDVTAWMPLPSEYREVGDQDG